MFSGAAGGNAKLSEFGRLILQAISYSIGDGTSLEGGVFFSDVGLIH